jgi:hypothetical protein
MLRQHVAAVWPSKTQPKRSSPWKIFTAIDVGDTGVPGGIGGCTGPIGCGGKIAGAAGGIPRDRPPFGIDAPDRFSDRGRFTGLSVDSGLLVGPALGGQAAAWPLAARAGGRSTDRLSR